jgi:hypothetical protein
MGEEVLGFMSNLNRSMLIGDEITAGTNTAVNVLSGKTPIRNVVSDFKNELGQERAREADFAARRPAVANVLAKGAGNSVLMAIPGAPVIANATRAGNMARGALTASTIAAGYGALDAGTAEERGRAATRNAANPLVIGLGAGAGALAPAASAAKAPSQRQVHNATMKDLGVELSGPQKSGGLLKQVEDLSMRAPILGPSISGARGRQVEQLNRGVGLIAVKSIGKTIPKTVRPGFDMVNYVDDAIGQVYDDAARLAPRVTPDQAFADDLARIAERKVDLADDAARLYDRQIGSRVSRLQRGEVDGSMVKQVHSELGKLQAEAARKGDQTLAEMLGDSRRAVIGLIERANPKARDMIRQADEAWSVYSVMNDAAAAASNRNGVFLPGQLNTQARVSAKRLGSNMAGKGRGTLQDVATAASQTLPDQFGNPGTANAVGLGAGGVGLLTEPVTTLTAGAGLAAASTPYLLMGRKVLESLPDNASAAQLQAAQRELARLAANDPAVGALQREVAARLARAVGVAGGASQAAPPQPRNVLATAPR